MAAPNPKVPFLDSDWLTSKGSDAARVVRLLAEHSQPLERLTEERVHRTVLFFGSARSKSLEDWNASAAEAAARGDEKAMEQLLSIEWMCEWYAHTQELAKRIGEWQLERCTSRSGPEYVIATGGGPGLMEAANRGAREGGARSMGVAVTLPFEADMNRFVDERLAFRMHYFSTRKMVLADRACGIIATPGGLGTFDELFELATLVQTGKVGGRRDPWKAHMPIVLLGGTAFWKKVFNLEALLELGTIAKADLDRMVFADTVDEAFEAVVAGLLRVEDAWHESEDDSGTPAAAASHGRSSSSLRGATGLISAESSRPDDAW